MTRAARIAGALYLLTNATAVSGFAIRQSLAGADASATARVILDSEWLYRLSVVADIVTVAGVVVLVWALYVLVRPVNRDLALLAAFLRLMECALLATMAVALLTGLRILSRPEYLGVFDPAATDALARLVRGVHGLGFGAGFVFLGLGSTVFSYLLLKSRVVPRWLAGWGVAASALMAVCSLLMMQLPGMASLLQIVSFAPMGAFELTMGGWLLLKGAAFGEPYGQESRS